MNKSKVVKCKCGRVLMATTAQIAETEKTIIDEYRKYANMGYEISIIDNEQLKELSWCDGKSCGHTPKQLLFD